MFLYYLTALFVDRICSAWSNLIIYNSYNSENQTLRIIFKTHEVIKTVVVCKNFNHPKISTSILISTPSKLEFQNFGVESEAKFGIGIGTLGFFIPNSENSKFENNDSGVIWYKGLETLRETSILASL